MSACQYGFDMDLIAFADHVEVFFKNNLHIEKFYRLEGSFTFLLKAEL